MLGPTPAPTHQSPFRSSGRVGICSPTQRYWAIYSFHNENLNIVNHTAPGIPLKNKNKNSKNEGNLQISQSEKHQNERWGCEMGQWPIKMVTLFIDQSKHEVRPFVSASLIGYFIFFLFLLGCFAVFHEIPSTIASSIFTAPNIPLKKEESNITIFFVQKYTVNIKNLNPHLDIFSSVAKIAPSTHCPNWVDNAYTVQLLQRISFQSSCPYVIKSSY